MNRRPFMRLLQNNQGQALLMILSAVAITGALLAAVLSSGSNRLLDSLTQKNKQDARERAEKAISLGGYLVANNFILCRKGGWRGLVQKCRWGGQLFMSENIAASVYKLELQEPEKGRLIFAADIDPQGVSNKPVKLSFYLESDGLIKTLVGDVSPEARSVDKDNQYVYLEAQADYLDSKGRSKTFNLTQVIRRPLGTPGIKLPNSPQCPAVCVASISEGPNPECRGPQEVPQQGQAAADIQVTNYGPGPIYSLKYNKTISFDPDYFPGRAPEISTIDMMTNDEVLMPGNSVTFSDSYPCVQPVSTTVTTSSSTTQRCWGCRGTGSTQQISMSQHEEDVATVSYDFPLDALGESLEPPRLARRLATVLGDVNQEVTVTQINNVTITYIPSH